MIVERQGNHYDLVVGTFLNAAMTAVATAVQSPARVARWTAAHYRTVLVAVAALVVAGAAFLGAVHSLANPVQPSAPTVHADTVTGLPARITWVEHKPDGSIEVITGDPRLMPAGADIYDGRTA